MIQNFGGQQALIHIREIGQGHKKRCKGLLCVQGPHLLSLYKNTNDKQYNLVQGPQLEVQGPFMCARASYFAFLPNY